MIRSLPILVMVTSFAILAGVFSLNVNWSNDIIKETEIATARMRDCTREIISTRSGGGPVCKDACAKYRAINEKELHAPKSVYLGSASIIDVPSDDVCGVAGVDSRDEFTKTQTHGTFPVPHATGLHPEPSWIADPLWDRHEMEGFWQCPVGYSQVTENALFGPSRHGEISGGSQDHKVKPVCEKRDDN